MTPNVPLETRISRTARYLEGVMKAGLEAGLDTEKLACLCQDAGDAFCVQQFGIPMMVKRAVASPPIPGGPNLADPAAWGGGGQQQSNASNNSQQPQPGQPPVAPPPPGPTLQNPQGVAPLPHRYNFHLDDTVHRIRRDQIAYAQKKQRESQEAQHYAGGPGLDGIAQTMDPNGQAGQMAQTPALGSPPASGPSSTKAASIANDAIAGATLGGAAAAGLVISNWLANRRQAKTAAAQPVPFHQLGRDTQNHLVAVHMFHQRNPEYQVSNQTYLTYKPFLDRAVPPNGHTRGSRALGALKDVGYGVGLGAAILGAGYGVSQLTKSASDAHSIAASAGQVLGNTVRGNQWAAPLIGAGFGATVGGLGGLLKGGILGAISGPKGERGRYAKRVGVTHGILSGLGGAASGALMGAAYNAQANQAGGVKQGNVGFQAGQRQDGAYKTASFAARVLTNQIKTANIDEALTAALGGGAGAVVTAPVGGLIGLIRAKAAGKSGRRGVLHGAILGGTLGATRGAIGGWNNPVPWSELGTPQMPPGWTPGTPIQPFDMLPPQPPIAPEYQFDQDPLHA